MSPEPARRKWEAWQVLAAALVVIVVVGVPVVASLNRKPLPPDEPEPAVMIGDPIRMMTSAGDRIFLVSEQRIRHWYWYTRGRMVFGGTQKFEERWHVDLWALDARDGRVLWRHRFADNGTGTMVSSGDVLTAEGDVLRVDLRRPLKLSAIDGRELDTPAGDVLPVRGHAVYDAYGTVTRGWRSDDGKRWLGLLTEEELQKLRSDPRWTPDSLAVPPIPGEARLYSSAVSRVSAAPSDWPEGLGGNWGERDAFKGYAPMPDARSFQQAGLLVAEARGPAIPMAGPTGALLLHRPEGDPAAPLRLARIDSAEGALLWDIALPQQRLDQVLMGEGNLVLSGPGRRPAPDQVSPERWFSIIVLADGARHDFELGAASRELVPAHE